MLQVYPKKKSTIDFLLMNKINISAENLEVRYSDKIILQDISFNFEDSNFISIIGPNGAGKSTLLKTIGKLLDSSQGSIYLDNKNLNSFNKNELAKIRTFVSAEESFNIELITVLDYLSLGRLPYQNFLGILSSNDKKIIKNVISSLEIENLIEKKLTELSSGEKQRIQLAKALVQEPSILLLDEPTSHLDVRYQIDLMKLLKKISLSGVKVITIIHDLNLASYFSDKLILMNKGKIISFDKPKDVLTEKNLEEVFKNKWDIFINPITNAPKVYPKIYESILKNKKLGKIHVICGGGTSREIISLLRNYDFDISLGIVNVMDSDYFLAKELGLKLIQEEPFSFIKDETRQKLRSELKNTDYIYLTKVSFGEGNLANLEELLYAQKKYGKIIITEENNFNDRDFCDGKALNIFKDLRIDYLGILDFLKQINEKTESNNKLFDIFKPSPIFAKI